MKTVFFTGSGDRGSSDISGKEFSKDEPAFELLGNLDELNSFIGFARAEAKRGPAPEDGFSVHDALKRLQELLFIAQAEVAARAFRHRSTEMQKILPDHVKYLENTIAEVDEKLPPLTAFVIQGEDELSARLDVARTIARRAERSAVKEKEVLSLSPDFFRFMNRLSSLLFALARYANYEKNINEDHPRYR